MTPSALFMPPQTLVLVGLMGAGKTAVGRRLAARLGLPFVDADHEIEAAAGCSIEDIFERYGEPAFRDVERRVIERLLQEPVHVMSAGGGAFIEPETRALIRAQALSLWLRAPVELLLARTARRSNRPLLKRGDPREILTRLKAERDPLYAEADMAIDSEDGPIDATVDRALEVLTDFLDRGAGPFRGGR
ncbi:MAG: shikimate kinase [Alphaproteobacteria bacterium]|jgi:shikimate kinase|nr:shikimate kinase [Alphaproteobacteria bacterium]